MARSRNIKPGAAKNEFLAQCSHAARLLFVMLPTIADREGRLEDRPMRIKGELFPYEQIDVDALLKELAMVRPGQDHAFIVRYQVGGVRYLQIVKFSENQNPHKDEKSSEIPPVPCGTSTKVPPCKVSAQHHVDTIPACNAGLKESEKRESVTGNQESGGADPEQPVDPFDRFWALVHQKIGKQQSKGAYAHAVKRLRYEKPSIDPHEFLCEKMAEFAETPSANPIDRAPIHPATWLNQGRYDDDPATWQRGSPGAIDPRGTSSAVQQYLADA